MTEEERIKHEKYLERGRKSAETQRRKWLEKSEQEKKAWSEKQKVAHSTEQFKETISKINVEYRQNISKEQEDEMNKKRSESMKTWWGNLSQNERDELTKKQLEGGAGWNHNTIQNTIKSKYGVDNVSQLETIKLKSKESMVKTCQERYGVDFNCLLPQCNASNGGTHTKPNMMFYALLKSNVEGYNDEYGIGREFVLNKYRYDFRLGNILFEIDPSATHNSTWGIHNQEGIDKNYHLNKSLCAKENNFRCIHVFDWDDQEKVIKLVVKSDRVYARECEIKQVELTDAIDFINTYHLQNYAKDSIRLGLYYNNELVSIMTFGKPRYNNKYTWELVRYCSSKNVIGGIEKLFKYFLDNYDGDIISYCDKSKFSGESYYKLGFTLIRDGKPCKHWYNIKTKQHITDNYLRQRGYDQLFGTSFGKGTSNEMLMLENGFVEVYDCGQYTFVYHREENK